MTLTSEPVGTILESSKPACGEQRAVLVLGAFFAAGDEEHHEVEELAAERFVAGWDDAFDDQQPAVGGHRAVAVAEDRERLFIFPVVDDVSHEEGHGPVRSRRTLTRSPKERQIGEGIGVEEAAGDEFAAVGEAGRGDRRLWRAR